MNFSKDAIDILKEQKLLPMSSKEITLNPDEQTMPIGLVTKQEIKIPKDKRDFLINNLTEVGKSVHNLIREEQHGGPHDIQHAYNNIEFYCQQKLLYVSRDALYYMDENPDAELPMNVFGAEYLLGNFGPIEQLSEVKKPRLKFPKYDKAVLRTFDETTYRLLPKGMSALYINLPLYFYEKIYIPEKALYYDLEEKKTYFCFEEFQGDTYWQFFSQCTKNIQPIVMKIRQGRITGVENIEELVIARYLQLPFIPAIVVADPWTDDYEQVVPPAESFDIKMANDLFYPYFEWQQK